MNDFERMLLSDALESAIASEHKLVKYRTCMKVMASIIVLLLVLVIIGL